MSPVPYTRGPFLAKIFLKIWFCKIDPLLPPHIDFNTIPYFTYGYPYRGVKEGKLKIWFCKIDPLLPPHIDFNTIPYFTYGYPYRGVKEGKLKKGPYLHFWAPPVQWWGQSRKLDNFLIT